jgi:hypothetical protein
VAPDVNREDLAMQSGKSGRKLVASPLLWLIAMESTARQNEGMFVGDDGD